MTVTDNIPIIAVPGQKPESIKVEPWTDFSRQSYSIIGDDFCHSKPFVAKFTAKGLRSTVNIKETLTKKEGKFNVEDDVKLWFDLPKNHSLYARVKSSSYVKVHYDHGIESYKGKNYNFYSTFWSDKSLSRSSVRVGVANLSEKCNSDNRLKIDLNSGSQSFYWYNRTMSQCSNNKFKFGLVSVVDLGNKVLQKNNLLLNYTHNKDHEGFIRLENDGFRKQNPEWGNYKSLWSSLTLNYVGRVNPTTRIGLEAALNLNDNTPRNVAAVVQKKIPEHKITLKAKITHKKDISLLFKRPLWRHEQLINLSAGLGVSDFVSDKRRIQHGIQVDFNI